MIKSMTGFGLSKVSLRNKTYNIEIKSVNSKLLDLSIRLNSLIKPFENDIKQIINPILDRGKVDFSIYAESQNTEQQELLLNEVLVKKYFLQLKKIAADLKVTDSDIFGHVLKIQQVYSKNEEADFSINDFKTVTKQIKEALNSFEKFRIQEGKALEKDFLLRLKIINNKIAEVLIQDKIRIADIRKKIRGNLDEVVDKSKVDKNRFEQEIIYYIEKLDITEEIVRLKNHLQYFVTTLKENASGKKLGFISQEIGREINTIGSKANNAKMQQCVVVMKDELEKIKEQINNVL